MKKFYIMFIYNKTQKLDVEVILAHDKESAINEFKMENPHKTFIRISENNVVDENQEEKEM